MQTRLSSCLRSFTFALLICGSANALSQSRLPPGVRGPDSAMATRSVSNYLMLERKLFHALDAGHRDAVAGMLDDGFGVRAATAQDEMATADWLKSESGDTNITSIVRDLAVREFDDVAVVSFLLDRRRNTKAKSVVATHFIVDVWRQSTRRLMARYVARPDRSAPPPSRPTGRE